MPTIKFTLPHSEFGELLKLKDQVLAKEPIDIAIDYVGLKISNACITNLDTEYSNWNSQSNAGYANITLTYAIVHKGEK